MQAEPNKPLSRSLAGLIAIFAGFLAFLLFAAQVDAQNKPRYLMPPPEFFQQRIVPATVVRSGDTLAVVSLSNTELTKTVRVRDDGKISLPLLQGISAAGLTLEQLQKDITANYSREYTHPDITVDMVAPANNMVYVTGEVGIGGPKEIRGRMTVAMALASSQIQLKTGKLKSTFLLRATSAGHYDVYKVDASFPSGAARDIELVPGDVIFVPKKLIATADDFVDLWIRQLAPTVPQSNLSVLFTPGNATTLASAAAPAK